MSLKNLSAKTKIPKTLINKLNDKKIIQIYGNFEKSLSIDDNFIVAVSGGPDSLALAFLAKIYSIRKRLTAKFLIIDHKLRKESTEEALKVKKILRITAAAIPQKMIFFLWSVGNCEATIPIIIALSPAKTKSINTI